MSSPAAKKAFDIAQEPDKLRDSYGRTSVGQGRSWRDAWWKLESGWSPFSRAAMTPTPRTSLE